jgi:hypothetical protein
MAQAKNKPSRKRSVTTKREGRRGNLGESPTAGSQAGAYEVELAEVQNHSAPGGKSQGEMSTTKIKSEPTVGPDGLTDDEFFRHFDQLVEGFVRRQQFETPFTLPQNAKRTAQSTWDAVLWVLREHGMARLYDPWVTNRLAQFSAEQVEELIAALTRLKSKPLGRKVTNELITKIANAVGQK